MGLLTRGGQASRVVSAESRMGESPERLVEGSLAGATIRACGGRRRRNTGRIQVQSITTTSVAGSAGEAHAHHWLIEEANGERSRGMCKRCGAVKDFKNWLEDSDFITNEEHRVAA